MYAQPVEADSISARNIEQMYDSQKTSKSGISSAFFFFLDFYPQKWYIAWVGCTQPEFCFIGATI